MKKNSPFNIRIFKISHPYEYNKFNKYNNKYNKFNKWL